MTFGRALEWFVLALIIMLGLMLLIGAAYAQMPLKLDACTTARINVEEVKNKTHASMDKAKAFAKRGSATRLAVLDAKTAFGYYAATRLLLPLACKGKELSDLDKALIEEMDVMAQWADAHW